MLNLCVLLVAVALAAASKHLVLPAPDASDEELRSSFVNFGRRYNKAYNSAQEKEERFGHFAASVKRAHALNLQRKADYQAMFGITPFSDLSPEEFASTRLSAKRHPLKIEELKHAEPFDAAETAGRLAGGNGLPSTFSWVEKGDTTPIKNQAQCGSCWAFSTTENVESVWIIAGRANATDLRLSPQQLVDCSDYDFGCDGGNPPFAFDSVIDEGGLMSLASYPYKAKDGTCKLNRNEIVAKISGYKFGNFPFEETEMQKSLVAWAPLSVCVDAAHWQDYQSGVMTADQCTPWHIDLLDHAVQLVGYNFTATPPYWIVRNSWSPSWGEDGFIHLEYGQNTCGIALETSTSYV